MILEVLISYRGEKQELNTALVNVNPEGTWRASKRVRDDYKYTAEGDKPAFNYLIDLWAKQRARTKI